jgi:hypothetical protein
MQSPLEVRPTIVAGLVGLALTASGAVSRAELAPGEPASEPRPRTTVQVDPLTTALGITHLLYERALGDDLAVYIGPSLRLYDSPLTDDAEEGYKAYGFEAGARYFFSHTAPQGWWAGLRLTVASMHYQDESRIGGYVSGLAGYAWILDGRWVLSAAIGASYFDYQVGGVGVDGVLPAAHTGIGIAF